MSFHHRCQSVRFISGVTRNIGKETYDSLSIRHSPDQHFGSGDLHLGFAYQLVELQAETFRCLLTETACLWWKIVVFDEISVKSLKELHDIGI